MGEADWCPNSGIFTMRVPAADDSEPVGQLQQAHSGLLLVPCSLPVAYLGMVGSIATSHGKNPGGGQNAPLMHYLPGYLASMVAGWRRAPPT